MRRINKNDTFAKNSLTTNHFIMANAQHIINQTLQTALSIVKILIKSRPGNTPPGNTKNREIVVLGNGPSLNGTIAEHENFLKERDLLAVNFAANTPIFTTLKPGFYMLTDPVFFNRTDMDNVQSLWNNFAKKVDWDMTLFIPTSVQINKQWKNLLATNNHISICTYNMTPVEGFHWFENLAYGKGWGMPRPRNVLIPSIMQAIAMRYKTIYIAGADHSWTKTLSVDDENRVVSIQPHFYKEAKSEEERIKVDYMNIKLHEVLESMCIAFRTYHTIKRYADTKSVKIVNITPGSFIDAFPRLTL